MSSMEAWKDVRNSSRLSMPRRFGGISLVTVAANPFFSVYTCTTKLRRRRAAALSPELSGTRRRQKKSSNFGVWIGGTARGTTPLNLTHESNNHQIICALIELFDDGLISNNYHLEP